MLAQFSDSSSTTRKELKPDDADQHIGLGAEHHHRDAL